MILVIIDVWLVNVSFRSRVKEYLPIVGLADFNKLSAKLIFGVDSNQNFPCDSGEQSGHRSMLVWYWFSRVEASFGKALSPTDLLACLATLMHNSTELSINETPKCSLILMDVDQSFLPIPSPIKAAIF
ncbi:hypothetical protein Pint_34022 [Pistacia integerrima]|uniref:Uncharacterized protein n=1 Tax=Pistacia integerrima TaxID=434235 RepID=A0ACC0X5A4_9ROSI|nr:hypothetical protein Pint_34022 [Pistacia integerrima]